MTTHNVITLQFHKRQDISSTEKRAENKRKLDYIPPSPKWMMLHYSSSVNEQRCVPQILPSDSSLSMREIIVYDGIPSQERHSL